MLHFCGGFVKALIRDKVTEFGSSPVEMSYY